MAASMPIAAPYVTGALDSAETVPDSNGRLPAVEDAVQRDARRDSPTVLDDRSVLDAGVAITRITGDRGRGGPALSGVGIGYHLGVIRCGSIAA
jgi:hypothetical protein